MCLWPLYELPRSAINEESPPFTSFADPILFRKCVAKRNHSRVIGALCDFAKNVAKPQWKHVLFAFTGHTMSHVVRKRRMRDIFSNVTRHKTTTITFKTTEKWSCIRRPPSRTGREEYLEAAATIMLEIMGNSQRELSAGEKKPLRTR